MKTVLVRRKLVEAQLRHTGKFASLDTAWASNGLTITKYIDWHARRAAETRPRKAP
ncbi:hypothetical protein [Amycolatopsis rubida]|uniref:hypothetical protein n=1 Tax=Amycolatopsis rubida TaxID=112413 RepID=UPI00142F313B|nr:hypothetical protein [Amycolatopsis rubida]